jgi:hypothetical protein
MMGVKRDDVQYIKINNLDIKIIYTPTVTNYNKERDLKISLFFVL